MCGNCGGSGFIPPSLCVWSCLISSSQFPLCPQFRADSGFLQEPEQCNDTLQVVEELQEVLGAASGSKVLAAHDVK